MSKFNQTRTEELTVNHEGYAAYAMDDKLKLVTMVLTSFFNEQKFYGDNSAELVETIKAVIDKDAQFVANLAVYARRVFNMRSVAHVIAAYLANSAKGKPFAKRVVNGVTVRADDVTELLSFYINTFGKPIPNSLRKGIAGVFQNFSEYDLAKYKGVGKKMKMKDILNICHPAPKSKAQSDMWKRCLEDRLAVPYTWEVELSKRGNTKEVWEELIDSGKVGYMALLRNLRNILQANPDNLNVVLDTLADPERVRKSKQLPFRFLAAYKAVADIASSKVFDTLEKAVIVSAEGMPKWQGRTVIAIDTSGSMSCKVSAKSDMTCLDIAATLGMLAEHFCEDAIVYTFDTEIEKLALSANQPVLTAACRLHAGGGTDMALPLEELIRKTIYVDRIVYLSDNECNCGFIHGGYCWYGEKPIMDLVRTYRNDVNRDVWVHAIDLQGYGTQQFQPKDSKVNIIAGWSDRVFDFIALAERGYGSIVKAIERYAW